MSEWKKSSYSAANGACLEWRRSSYSFSNGNCLEWRKSSFSNPNGECVEVAAGVQVRDSRLGDASPVLSFPAAAWAAFTGGLR